MLSLSGSGNLSANVSASVRGKDATFRFRFPETP